MTNYLIWGTGNKTKELLQNWENGEIIAFVESFPKINSFMDKPVISPKEIEDYQYDVIIITPLASQEIVDICEKVVDTSKEIIVLYWLNLKKWNKYLDKSGMLNGIVNFEWLGKLMEQQGIYSKMFSPEMLECYAGTEYYNALKHSICKDGRIHLINTEDYINRYYDIGKKLVWNYEQKCWQIYCCDEWILFPISWNKKKCALTMRVWLEKNEINSPLRSCFENEKTINNIVMIGDDILISAVKCAKSDKIVYLLDKTKYEMLNGMENIVLLNELSELQGLKIDAARIDVNDVESLAIIMNFMQKVKRIEIVSYYPEVAEYLSGLNQFEFQYSNYVYYPTLRNFEKLTNSIQCAKTVLYHLESLEDNK